jgi:hypothetical protein
VIESTSSTESKSDPGLTADFYDDIEAVDSTGALGVLSSLNRAKGRGNRDRQTRIGCKGDQRGSPISAATLWMSAQLGDIPNLVAGRPIACF